MDAGGPLLAAGAFAHSAGRLVEESPVAARSSDSTSGSVGGSPRDFAGERPIHSGGFGTRAFDCRVGAATAVGGEKTGQAKRVRYCFSDRLIPQHVGGRLRGADGKDQSVAGDPADHRGLYFEKANRPNWGSDLWGSGLHPLAADLDHEWLARQIQRLRVGLVEDATAVGDGLGLAVSRLEQTDKEKEGLRKGAFIILLTDGSNNSGVLAPRQAAELAKKKGIPVYTIGAGRPGVVPMPVIDNAGRKLGYRQAISDLDEDTLQRIAETTGGKFFRAMDLGTAEAAFSEIDKRQRIEFSAKAQLRAHEWFFAWVGPGVVAFFGGLAWARPGRWGRAA